MSLKTGLEKIIDIKDKELEVKKGELAKVTTSLRAVERELELLEGRLSELVVRAGEEVDPDELFLRSGGVKYIVNVMKVKNEEVERLERLKEQKRDEIATAHREIRGYERLHSQRLKKLERELQKKLDREVDDIFSNRMRAT